MKQIRILLQIILILNFAQASYAQNSSSESQQTQVIENQNFESNEKVQQALNKKYLEDYVDLINRLQLSKQTSYKVSNLTVENECVSFMNKDLVLGSVGKAIYNSIGSNSDLYPNLVWGGSISKYCSKYPKMALKQKALVWVMLMTAMAQFESSCQPTASAKGPNGTAYGLYQLHKGKEDDYNSGAIKACRKNASKDPIASTTCALMMIENQLEKSGGKLFYNESYWDVLRPNGQSGKAKLIAESLRQSTLCNPTSL